jgi:hypothetical protein
MLFIDKRLIFNAIRLSDFQAFPTFGLNKANKKAATSLLDVKNNPLSLCGNLTC